MWLVYFCGTILLARFTYWLRVRHRAIYGIGEIAIALVIIYQATSVGSPGFLLDEDADMSFFLLGKIIAFFAGIYAFVRGIDNIVVGVRGEEAH